jgi:hypothetical protein
MFVAENEAKKYRLKKTELEQAMRDLFASNRIHVETYGKKHHERLAAGGKP